ncbi:hypothetical protein [Amycolatopsis sp. CFH S0078]|uniref:hypothetical protein n=1 Tax=Amycolatopsis sp. CFH S0078 TaxID=1644108 RepID=UPI00106E80EC|nr:hypothetical protein [Amycolatopsis sp. CFH S0078]
MPGYLNRFIDIDLSEYGEGCYVRIHNPKIVPQSMLEPTTRVEVDADGKAVDRDIAAKGSDEVMCRLIKDWCVYDMSDLDVDEPPPLTLPATPEQIAKLPIGIKLQVSKAIADAMPSPK